MYIVVNTLIEPDINFFRPTSKTLLVVLIIDWLTAHFTTKSSSAIVQYVFRDFRKSEIWSDRLGK